MIVKWDQSEFNRTLEEYKKFTRRTMVEVLNNKAYYVARAACWFTHKADYQGIRRGLSDTSLAMRVSPNKRKDGSEQGRPPLIAAIINARLGRKKSKGLYGPEMKDKAKRQIAARVRSTGFIKSGWIPAIRGLEALVTTKVGAAPVVPLIELITNPEGTLSPASEGKEIAVIENQVKSRTASQNRVYNVAVEGLQRGFNNETAEMQKYIERKMAERAARDSAK